MKISNFEEWTDEQGEIEEEKGIWSEFASEGLLIDKSKPGVIRKVNLEYDGISELW